MRHGEKTRRIPIVLPDVHPWVERIQGYMEIRTDLAELIAVLLDGGLEIRLHGGYTKGADGTPVLREAWFSGAPIALDTPLWSEKDATEETDA